MYALLIAENPDDIAIWSTILQRAGLAVTTTKDFDKAMQTWLERPADLLLLALTDPAPLEQVRRVRLEAKAPLLVVVNAHNEQLYYDLLSMGADLVVGPSFNPKLMIAQVIGLMRRAGSVPAFSLPTLSAANLTLDPATRTLRVNEKPAQRLTHLEFRLLYTLMTNRGQVIPTETIVERVWGYTGQGDRDLVRGLISRLRNKVETDPHKPEYILTMSGIGYSFRAEER